MILYCTKLGFLIYTGMYYIFFRLQIDYKIRLEEMKQKTLQVSVWDHDVLKENNLLGAVYIKLRDVDVTKEIPKWYHLEKIQITSSNTV